MRRGRRGDRIVYIDRPWRLSLICFLAALAVVVFFSFGRSKDAVTLAAVYGGMFLLCALVLQFRSRAFVIDPEGSRLSVYERQLLRPVRRLDYPLAGLRAITTSAARSGAFDLGGMLWWIWIEAPNRPRVLFKGNLTNQERVRDIVARLTEDLQEAASTAAFAAAEPPRAARNT